MRMKKTVIWLDNYLEEFFMVISLILMTVIMGIQVFSRYVLGSAPSWSEEITRYLFVWSGFLSVSYCTKKFHSPYLREYRKIGHPTGAVTAECDAYKMTQDYGC